jgi:hypothetical protein
MSTKAPAEREATCVALFGIDSSGNLVALKVDDTGRVVPAGAPTALGQATMANSTPVAIASDQSAVAVKGGAANLAAPSGNPIPIAGFDSGNSGRVQVPDIDSNGGLRLQSGGASGAAVPTRVTQVGGPDGGGLLRGVRLSAAGITHTVPGVGASYTSTAAEASCVASASACAPARVSMTNGNAGTRYCLMFDATSLPANGAIPKDGGGAQSTNARNFLVFPVPTARFSTGLVVASSSTASSLTIGSADALFSVDLFPATA